MSILELPAVVAADPPVLETHTVESLRLWLVRVLSSGIAFVACAFLVGRLTEGLAPGYGGVSLVAFSLGTLVAPFGAANFEHVTAGMLGLAAFAFAWPGARPLRARSRRGRARGVRGRTDRSHPWVYVALQGSRPLLRYAAGVVPGAALLATYDSLAFGSPWHFSYRYIVGENATNQSSGFFGIHAPYAHAVREVFVGSGGLLVTTPVVLAAAAGLIALGRRYRAEAIVCAAITIAFLLLDCGYFLPYGGVSPGPRFVIPCLPFLALRSRAGVSRSRFGATALLAAASIIATTGLTLTWVSLSPDPGSIWSQLAHLPVDPSQIVQHLSSNVVVRLGFGRSVGAVFRRTGRALRGGAGTRVHAAPGRRPRPGRVMPLHAAARRTSISPCARSVSRRSRSSAASSFPSSFEGPSHPERSVSLRVPAARPHLCRGTGANSAPASRHPERDRRPAPRACGCALRARPLGSRHLGRRHAVPDDPAAAPHRGRRALWRIRLARRRVRARVRRDRTVALRDGQVICRDRAARGLSAGATVDLGAGIRVRQSVAGEVSGSGHRRKGSCRGSSAATSTGSACSS